MGTIFALLFAIAAPAGAVRDIAPAFTEETRILAAPNRVLAKFHTPSAKFAAARMGCSVIREIPRIGYTVLRVPYGKVDATIRRLREAGLVEEVSCDRAYQLAYVPNDPLFGSQWNLFDQRIPQVWDVTKGDDGVVIAVLDTGVDYNHNDLAANIWHNSDETVNGQDSDGNGYVDDTIGWDFAYGDRDPRDDHGHGTSCAGINAAVQDNNYQISGIAPRCKIMCVKIGLSNGYSYDSMFAPGIIYAADNGAKVMSISYFSDGLTPALRAAADYAYDHGALLCVAAGNFDDIYPLYPAGYDTAVAVAAHTPSRGKAYFSTFGTWVDVTAPGTQITTSTMGGGYTTGFAGTSAAAPNAAGVAALLFSAFPGETNEEIRRRLEYSTHPMPPIPEGEVVNYGYVDARAALGDFAQGAGVVPVRRKGWDPEIRWVSPVRLPEEGGTLVIAGRRFGPSFEAGSAHLGGIALPVRRWTDSRIEVTVPAGTPSGMIRVVHGAPSNEAPVEIGPSGATYVAVPTDFSYEGFPIGGSGIPSGTTADLWFEDGKKLHAAVDAGTGGLTMKVLVRGLDKNTISQLRIGLTRTYPAVGPSSTGGISLYDFSTGSYPYGSWSAGLQDHPSEGTATVTVDLTGDVSRFVSYEGDLFLRFRCSLGNPQAYADIDRLWVEWK